jgi:hypothetical protein
MARVGTVRNDLSAFTWNGTTVKGQLSRVEWIQRRPAISWEVFGTEVMQKDAGSRDESARITGVYTEGGTEAYEMFYDSYEGANGGTAGTPSLTVLGSGDVYSGRAKVTELTPLFAKGEVSTFTVELTPEEGWTKS